MRAVSALLLPAALVLGGCLPAPGGSGKPPLAKAVLAGGAVTVSGPEGYCIDPATLTRGLSSDFALIASCMALSEGKVGFWVEPVLVTVTVGAEGPQEPLPTAGAIAATAGATLLGGGMAGGFVTANLDRGGEKRLTGGDPRHWRGAFAVNGRLVMLALYAPEGSEYAGARGGRMLSQVRDQIEALSAARTDPVAAEPMAAPAGETAPTGGPARTATRKKAGLFGRLFNPKDLP